MKSWFRLTVKGGINAVSDVLLARGIKTNTAIDPIWISDCCQVGCEANWADIEAWFLERGKAPFADGALLHYRNIS
jgi:hypothetical protein